MRISDWSSDVCSSDLFELGRIESPLARQFFPAIFLGRHARTLDGFAKLGLGLVPHFVGAEAHVGTQRELHRIFLESELPIDAVEQRAEIAHFLDDLVFAAEDMAVRSEEHTSELQSLMRISYADFCLTTKN